MADNMKTPSIAVMIAKHAPSQDESSHDDGAEERSAIAEEILSAIKKNDADALGEALYNFYETCDSYDDDDSDQ